MKKNFLIWVALIALFLFNSCDKEVIYVQDETGDESVSDLCQIITLQVENGGDGLMSRAGRPLYSAEAKQTIENVKVIVCDGTNVVYTHEIIGWDSSSSIVYSESGTHGRKATIKLEGDSRLAKGKQYTVYAIGYHDNSNYKNVESTTGLNALLSAVKKGNTFNENMTLKYASSNNAEEIFAGSANLSIAANGAGFVDVILNRQVAGAFVYLKNIPYYSDAAKIDLVASKKNDQLVLGQFANKNLTSNGSNSVEFSVVNGWSSEIKAFGQANETVIASVTLSEWFTSIVNKDGLIDDVYWKNKYGESSNVGNNPAFQKGSVFAGTFLIPFVKVDGIQTLKLVMKNNQDTQLAFWNVNLSVSGNNYDNLYIWNGSTFGEKVLESGDKNSYSIVRNHIYSIGTRMVDDPGENPDSNVDKPESLNNKQELALKVSDNWDVIHEMDLEQN